MYLPLPPSSTAAPLARPAIYGRARHQRERHEDLISPASIDISLEQLTIRRLRSQQEIREMAQLRQQIDLAAASSAEPQFFEREKKETNWGWSSLLNCTAR